VRTLRRSIVLAVALAGCWLGAAGCDAGQGAAADDAAVDADDALDVSDVIDASDALDASDAFDASDVIDVSDAFDALDASDVGDAFDVGALVGNARCESATPLVDGVALDGQDLAAAALRAQGCFPIATSPSLYYRATVGPAERLSVVVTPLAGGAVFNPVLRVQPACGADRCITQSIGTRERASTTWTNYSDLTQTVVVSVSSTAPVGAGRFRLEPTIGRLVRNASCATATPLALDTPLRAQAFGDADVVLPVCVGSGMLAGGPTLYYRVTVPGAQALHVTATPSSNAAPVLRLLDRCDTAGCGADGGACPAATCLADSGRAASGSLAWVNPGAAAREVFVVAGAYPSTRGAVPTPFDLYASAETPPAEASCAGAIEVGEASPSPVASTAGAVSLAPLCADNVASGPALWYRVRVPAGRILVARAVRMGGASDPVLRLYSACGAACLVPAVRDNSAVPTGIRWVNPGAAEATVLLAVAMPTGAAMSFRAEVTLRAPAANAVCVNARAVTDGDRLAGENLDDAGEAPPACAGLGAATAGLWYRATVPAGRTLVVTARRPVVPVGGATWTPTLRVLAGCGAATQCQAISTAGTDASTAYALWRNPGAADAEVRVALGSSLATSSGPVDLRFDLAPAPTPLTCAAAELLGAHEQRAAQLVGEGDAAREACPVAGTGSGGALYYRVTVPPGATLTASALRTGGASWNPVLNLSPSCGAPTCLAGSTAEAGGAVLRWRNPDAEARDAVLGLYQSVRVTPAAASLAVRIDPPRYASERVAAACEAVDMGWTSVMLGGGAASPVYALPFPFGYFGDAVTHWSMSANGFAQLWPGPGGAPVGTGANVALPATTAPAGLVAAYWDSFGQDNATTRFFFRDVPGPGRHLTATWNNVQLVGTPITFQLKLYAETDVIEFHYCMINASAGGGATTGAGGTIGLQDTTGLQGFQNSYNQPDAIAQGAALRFTPLR
jgi:hypothetical protein